MSEGRIHHMQRMSFPLTVCLFACALSGCTRSTTPKSTNHQPMILSIRLFPSSIGVNDSILVAVNAYDPDGDTLVYDWETDGRLHIQGALGSDPALYNTSENARTCYPIPSEIPTPVDTLWIKCFARDGRGRSDNRRVTFTVHQ